ncbi:MAG: glycine cleavage system protein GcvH [Candidatus Bathyarchaeia archaeon]|jgi:glycine cleavage system H protein
MVEIGEYEVREGLYYHKEHFWAKIEDGLVRFGATDYGQKALKEIVFVELLEVGDEVKQNDAYGTLESVKAVVDLIAPVSGTVKEVNEALMDNPDAINKDPYGNGWLITVTPSDADGELENIMDFDAAVDWYKALVEEG